jgi:predicted regulator of Ras-like GTPase activity (Roadblock/LC7/MglB family)
MALKLDGLLMNMSTEISGYIASAVVGNDGINIAQHTNANVDPEAISGQMTVLLKLVDTTITKLNAGVVEDNLTTTRNAYILLRFLSDKQHFLCLAVDHQKGNLGNMRLISKIYVEKINKALPS